MTIIAMIGAGISWVVGLVLLGLCVGFGLWASEPLHQWSRKKWDKGAERLKNWRARRAAEKLEKRKSNHIVVA